MRLLILLLPWIELFGLIQLGVETSALTALAYVLATLALGIVILRRQGAGMFERLRETQQGRILGPELLLEDMAVGLAGLLLIIPGIITDVLGLIVLIGPLRRRLSRALRGPQPEPYAPELDREEHATIEGQFRRVNPDNDV